MWVFTHSLLASHSSNECQDCRDQSINKCLSSACYLGEDIILLSAKGTGSERGVKAILLPQGLKLNLPACVLTTLQGGLRVASRRGESHLFFIPPLLYKHTRGSIDPSDGLDQYRSSFIANFYRKPTNDLLVFGEMFDCISTSTFVELLMLKNCFSCFNLT